MNPDQTFNQPGTSAMANRPAYNNGTSYQSNKQVAQQPNVALGNDATNTNHVTTPPSSSSVTSERTDWVRFNTICSKELTDKIRAIADRSHSSIRDVVELMFRRGINAYEQKNGIITIEPKKPLEDLF
jgi:hypothetical protein